jgi:hypothetical protein
MQCDCESVALTVRQVLTIAAVVVLAIAVARTVATAIPVILSTVILRFLPRFIANRLTSALPFAKQITEQARTIEGVFVRVREEAIRITRAGF